MNTILKKLAGLALGVALFAPSVQAQSAAPAAQILNTNTDLKNRRVFVELSFTGQRCATYNLKFRFTTITDDVTTDYGYQPIAAVLGGKVQHPNGSISECHINADTTYSCNHSATLNANELPIAKLKNGDTTMYDMKIQGYTVVINVPQSVNLTPGDSVSMCMDAIVFASQCVGCGVANSDMVFIPATDIKPGCPDADKLVGLVACYQRDSRAANWEGWISDPRDCTPYRIVRMPDNRWWFAQNLRYLGAGISEQTSASNMNGASNSGDGNILKTAWYAGGKEQPGGYTTSIVEATTGASLMPAVVPTYGYLYPWGTAMSADGNADTEAAVINPMGQNVTSDRQVICPDGWLLPSRYDWGKMINLVERECGSPCPDDGDNAAGADHKQSPCYHNYITNGTSQWAASRCAFKDLLSTDVAPWRDETALGGTMNNYNGDTAVMPRTKLMAPGDIITYATSTNPVWNYFLPETAGTDRYGFSIKPAGMRNGVNSTSGGNGFFYRGEFAGFWTSTHDDVSIDPAYAVEPNAYMVGFRYNYRMNADFNSAVQSWAVDKRTGLSVRCVAKTVN